MFYYFKAYFIWLLYYNVGDILMSLAGYLSEYSLAEIFHFVQDGNKTGLLWLEPEPSADRAVGENYYLAFQAGRIVSVATDRNVEHSGLLKMASQRRWLTPEQVKSLEIQLSFLPQPLGTYLKSRNILNNEQLTLLFNAQVVAATCKLFEIQQGKFKFDPKASLAYGEMTGISLPAAEIALLGLRMLKNWSALASKLPDPAVAIQRLTPEPQGLRLDTNEWQVWQLALGELSIAKIAEKLNLSIVKVQQIGFRLSSIGLVQEVSAEVSQPPTNKMMEFPKSTINSSNAAPISASFLGNLMGFLKKKV
jgi:hypothetical protein